MPATFTTTVSDPPTPPIGFVLDEYIVRFTNARNGQLTVHHASKLSDAVENLIGAGTRRSELIAIATSEADEPNQTSKWDDMTEAWSPWVMD